MNAKEYLRKHTKISGSDNIILDGGLSAFAKLLESYHQAKSKEEAEERFHKACTDYFNTDNNKTVHENLHWAAFGKEES